MATLEKDTKNTATGDATGKETVELNEKTSSIQKASVVTAGNAAPSTLPSSSEPAAVSSLAAVTTAKVPAASSISAQVVAARRPVSVPATGTSAQAAAALRAATVSAGSSKSKKKKSQPTVTMATAPSTQSNDKGTQGENTGRWTAEEHRLFLQGLEQHGKGWKKIASLIKSRTVVQIRTHAQKYFQKLAKARQNGEEGEITMEGRGGVSSVASVSTAVAAQTNKRRRLTTGTKRKAIQSVVSSAQRQGKKLAGAAAGVPNPVPPLPAVAPTLAHFVLPNAANAPASRGGTTSVPSISTSQGTISGPALEDSIFRFLTPAPVAVDQPQVNEVARQAGANPITVPTENPSAAPTIADGEISPTGVPDLSIYPSWTDAKDTPSWYAKGADVDALLDVGDALDWLADSGDLHETYQPPAMDTNQDIPEMVEPPKSHSDLGQSGTANNASVSTLPHVDSNVESVVPPLPSLFEGTTDSSKPETTTSMSSSTQLKASASATGMGEHLQVFENPMEEHDFISTILENNNESSASLPTLN